MRCRDGEDVVPGSLQRGHVHVARVLVVLDQEDGHPPRPLGAGAHTPSVPDTVDGIVKLGGDAVRSARRPLTSVIMADSRQGALTGLHILVVEDDTDGRVILKSLLGYFGALVTAVPSVRDATRELRHVAPDVVIADVILGRGTAFKLVADARQGGSRVPFIAISGHDYDSRELERAGFAGYLRKPLDHNKLVDTILAVVPRR